MKRHTLYIYAFALSAFALASCSKDLTEGLDDVNVGVATDAGMQYGGVISAKKGQPVEFVISGEPDFVTFFSGETGHQYAYRERTSLNAEDIITSTMSVAVYASTAINDNNNCLNMYYTFNDPENGYEPFPGLVETDVEADSTTVCQFELDGKWHEWVEQADFKSLPTTVTNAPTYDFFEETGHNMKDLIGKDLVLAFKYGDRGHGEKENPGTIAQPRYNFAELKIVNTMRDGQTTELFASGIGLTAINMHHERDTAYYEDWKSVQSYLPADLGYGTVTANVSGRWNMTNASAGNFYIHSTAANYAWKSSWLVSKPIDILACEPDRGENIKNISQDVPTYTYTYNKVGTYTATFVVTNGNYKHEDRGVYQIVVNVTE